MLTFTFRLFTSQRRIEVIYTPLLKIDNKYFLFPGCYAVPLLYIYII